MQELTTNPPIFRYKTAIKRPGLSKPVRLALDHGIIRNNLSFFDYGCGHGRDVQLLKQEGIDAFGWDPHYFPKKPKREADVVNLGYVLNVIESEQERVKTLRNAYRYSRRALIVSVRTDSPKRDWAEFSDGYLTSRSTFQRFFRDTDLMAMFRTELGKRVEVSVLCSGIAVIFKNTSLKRSCYSKGGYFSNKLRFVESDRLLV